jgi:hypothetical protein
MEHHLIQRQIEVGVVLTVVGNLQGEVLAVRKKDCLFSENRIMSIGY